MAKHCFYYSSIFYVPHSLTGGCWKHESKLQPPVKLYPHTKL